MSKTLEENNNTNSQTQLNSENQEPNLMNILVGSLVPLIPIVLAKLTGQKLPMASLVPNQPQDPLEKLTPVLQSMINTQNILLQEIALLKKNDQIFQTFRLTHEKKQIDFNSNLENHD